MSILDKWFISKYDEFDKLPEKPSRAGIPRDDSKPIPKAKAMCALYKTIDPDLSLKLFAEKYGTPYGTVRNWMNDGVFLGIMETLGKEYFSLQISQEMQKGPVYGHFC